MTRFAVGSKVESLVSTQGMTTGERFIVVDVQTQRTAFGGFTTYTLDNNHHRVTVRNGHLVLKEIA